MKISSGKSDLANYSVFGVGFAFEDDLKVEMAPGAKARYEKMCKAKAFAGKLLQSAWMHEGEKTALVFGLGKKSEFNLEWLRRGAANAYRFAQAGKYAKIEIALPETSKTGSWKREAELAQAVCEGALIASCRMDKYKTKDAEEEKARVEPELVVCGKSEKEIAEGIFIGRIMGEAQNFARELDENPGNTLNPAAFAEEAKRLAKQHGMKVEVLGKSELQKKGMNGILAVGMGSASEPMLVAVEYEGAKSAPLYSIVGKGITFDSGGISLKPARNMHDMKYDKSGACIVLGVLKAAAELKLPVRILGVVPLAENMPSGSAGRPGDIVKMYNGKTVEILNTDAEGRLILADALAYAAERKPAAIIDVATLTGAIVTCLGRHAIGLFSNDAKLAATIRDAGNRTYERVWEFPVWKEYSEMVKGDFADLRNQASETGEGSSITAAAFLKEFVGETKWAHLDIAGVDYVAGKHPLVEKGALGTGTRLIIQSLLELAKK
ncbi:MAG: leucyl aminopeptidase [Candidatus Micrarchaeia archaeon]